MDQGGVQSTAGQQDANQQPDEPRTKGGLPMIHFSAIDTKTLKLTTGPPIPFVERESPTYAFGGPVFGIRIIHFDGQPFSGEVTVCAEYTDCKPTHGPAFPTLKDVANSPYEGLPYVHSCCLTSDASVWLFTPPEDFWVGLAVPEHSVRAMVTFSGGRLRECLKCIETKCDYCKWRGQPSNLAAWEIGMSGRRGPLDFELLRARKEQQRQSWRRE